MRGLTLTEIAMALVVVAVAISGVMATYQHISEKRKVNILVNEVVDSITLAEKFIAAGKFNFYQDDYVIARGGKKNRERAYVHVYDGRLAVANGIDQSLDVVGSYVVRVYDVPTDACKAVRDLPLNLKYEVIYTYSSYAGRGWKPIDGEECLAEKNGIGFNIY